MATKYSYKEYRQLFVGKHPHLVLTSKAYVNADTKMTARCSLCKHTFTKKAAALLHLGCTNCARVSNKEAKHSDHSSNLDEKIVQLRNDNPAYTFNWITKGVKSSDSTLEITHSCGRHYSIALHRFNGRCRCNTGGSRVGKRTTRGYEKKLATIRSDLIVRSEYIDSTTNIDHECVTCGYTWGIKPYNAFNGLGCPKCINRLKAVTIQGKTFMVQGYEDKALVWMSSEKGVDVERLSEFHSGQVPTFHYKFNGKNRQFKPDFLLDKDTIIEVKGTATFGLVPSHYAGAENGGATGLFYKTAAKAKQVLREGYKFRLLLIDSSGKRIPLPKNWYDMSLRSIKAHIANCS